MRLVSSFASEYHIRCDVCGNTFAVAKDTCNVDYAKKIIFANLQCSCGNTRDSVSFAPNASNKTTKTQHNQLKTSSWIFWSKFITIITFFGIAIFGGMVLGEQFGPGAFAISVIVAFLVVTAEMIILNLAEDVSHIKQILQDKSKK